MSLAQKWLKSEMIGSKMSKSQYGTKWRNFKIGKSIFG